MKQRLIYILKHNTALQKIYKACMSFVFRFLGIFISTDKNLVLISSFMGSNCNDSPKAIYESVRSNPKYNNLRFVWAFEHPEKFPELQSGFSGNLC